MLQSASVGSAVGIAYRLINGHGSPFSPRYPELIVTEARAEEFNCFFDLGLIVTIHGLPSLTADSIGCAEQARGALVIACRGSQTR